MRTSILIEIRGYWINPDNILWITPYFHEYKWKAVIRFSDYRIHFGSFDNEQDAKKLAKEIAEEINGQIFVKLK